MASARVTPFHRPTPRNLYETRGPPPPHTAAGPKYLHDDEFPGRQRRPRGKVSQGRSTRTTGVHVHRNRTKNRILAATLTIGAVATVAVIGGVPPATEAVVAGGRLAVGAVVGGGPRAAAAVVAGGRLAVGAVVGGGPRAAAAVVAGGRLAVGAVVGGGPRLPRLLWLAAGWPSGLLSVVTRRLAWPPSRARSGWGGRTPCGRRQAEPGP